MANVRIYSKSKNGNLKLSEHFTVQEFACHDGSDTIKIDLDMIPVLERFREYVEVPVSFNSAYRTESYNKKVGGASQSYHKYGRAFDIPFKSNYKYLTSRAKMCAFFNTLGVKGIIIYPTFVHVDSRTNNYHANNKGVRQSYGKVTIPFRNILKQGSKEVDVGILQFKLNKLGYNCGNCDMYFGAKTGNSVKTFQKANGLVADGIIGEKTWDKIF